MNKLDTYEKLAALAAKTGFDHFGPLKKEALVVRQEVRDMCAVNRCGKFGTFWVCPPGCGTLEELTEKLSKVTSGIILQSTGEMEDDFDFESIAETSELQKERFAAFMKKLAAEDGQFLPLSSGGCGICEKCTYPDAPCRFPDRAFPSMEACGLVVNDVCKASGIPYNYGPRTMTFTGCVLYI